jgi:hypothetical protein
MGRAERYVCGKSAPPLEAALWHWKGVHVSTVPPIGLSRNKLGIYQFRITLQS